MVRPWVNWHPCWCCDKNPKIHLNYFQILQISHAKTKSGSLSSNLTFFGFNMATKRDHSQWWRYQRGCWFTLAVRKLSQLHCLESERSLCEKSVLPKLPTGFEGEEAKEISWESTLAEPWVPMGASGWPMVTILELRKIKESKPNVYCNTFSSSAVWKAQFLKKLSVWNVKI